MPRPTRSPIGSGPSTTPAAARQAPAAGSHPDATGDPAGRQSHVVGRLHDRCRVVGSAVPDLQRQRRLQPRIAADRDRHQPAVCPGRPCARRTDRDPRHAAAPATRQRAGIHQSGPLQDWATRHGVALVHIQPGKPTQNAYIERFNRTFRTEVLDRYVFENLNEVRRMAEDWRHRYNHQRPHRALGGLPPVPYALAHSPHPLPQAVSEKRGRYSLPRGQRSLPALRLLRETEYLLPHSWHQK